MNNKFSKNELLEMINSKLTNLTEEEISELITEELNKENAQIDMDYIDVCYDLLEVKRSAVNHSVKTDKHKIKKPIKVLLIAATFVVVIVSAITVSAQFVRLSIPQDIPTNIAQINNGHAEINYDLDSINQTAEGYALLDTDLAKQLANYDISPVTLPEEMTKKNCKITHIERLFLNEILNCVSVDFEYNGQSGYLIINQLHKNYGSSGLSVIDDVKSGKMITVNGMDILVFERDHGCEIKYKDNFTSYDISLDCDLETAIKFVKTIK